MKKPLINDDERKLFRAQMEGVKPLAKKVAPPDAKPKPTQLLSKKKMPFLPERELSFIEPCSLYGEPGELVYGEDFLQFARTGLQHRALQALKRKEFAIEAELDLHGMTIEQAHVALHAFLSAACLHHKRYLHVIHGKGTRGEAVTPILKNKVNQWLRQYAEVLAFCSARPKDGGVGAVYVLLRRGSNVAGDSES